MIIRKLFKFEGAHIVRNCTSQRCSQNIHGHSYVVEVFVTSDHLDNGFMILDFGRMKEIKKFIDNFDHTFALWDGEEEEIKQFIHHTNRRVAEIPVNPSAEGLALLFLYAIDKILENQPRLNGEGNVQVSSVRVHETETGYAEAFREDLNMVKFSLMDIRFSDGITNE